MSHEHKRGISQDGSIQSGDVIATHCDYDTVSISGPISDGQIIPRRQIDVSTRGQDIESSLPNLAGSTNCDTIYLLTREPTGSNRKWLVGVYCFLFMAGYVTSYFTFIQYVYAKVQKELYPGLVSLNVSGPCSGNTSTEDDEKQTKIQQTAATWSMYFSLASGIPSIFSNMILGSSTDKFGRKFLFFLPCIGTFFRMSFSVIGIYLDWDLKYHLIGYSVEGFTGQMFTMLIVCFTYVADITEGNGKQRTFGITLVELSIGLAFTIVSFTTGYFIQYFGFFYPMLSAGILMGMATLVVFFIPESFPQHKRNPSGSVLKKLKTAYDLFLGSFNRGRRWMFNILLTVFALSVFCIFGRGSVEPLYQLDSPFCFSSVSIGYFGTVRSISQQTVGMLIIKLLQKIFSDEAIAMLGCISSMGGMLLEGLAKTDTVLYIVPAIGAFGMLTIPMCRSLLSKLTTSDQQGAVFAAIAAVESGLNLAAGVAAAAIYNQTVGMEKGFVFFVFSGSSAIGLALLWIFKQGSRQSAQALLKIR